MDTANRRTRSELGETLTSRQASRQADIQIVWKQTEQQIVWKQTEQQIDKHAEISVGLYI